MPCSQAHLLSPRLGPEAEPCGHHGGLGQPEEGLPTLMDTLLPEKGSVGGGSRRSGTRGLGVKGKHSMWDEGQQQPSR